MAIAVTVWGILAGALALVLVLSWGGSVLLGLAAYALGGMLAATLLAGGALWRAAAHAQG